MGYKIRYKKERKWNGLSSVFLFMLMSVVCSACLFCHWPEIGIWISDTIQETLDEDIIVKIVEYMQDLENASMRVWSWLVER